MAAGTVTLPDGTKIDNTALTQPDGTTIERQRVDWGDGSIAAADLRTALNEIRDEIIAMKWALLGRM